MLGDYLTCTIFMVVFGVLHVGAFARCTFSELTAFWLVDWRYQCARDLIRWSTGPGMIIFSGVGNTRGLSRARHNSLASLGQGSRSRAERQRSKVKVEGQELRVKVQGSRVKVKRRMRIWG